MRIERILAGNPGPFTGPGTNTWLLDDDGGSVVVIDPGPVDPAHLEKVLGALSGRRPVGVLVTHTHVDHAPLANPLARELGAPSFGYASGPEFDPDLVLGDGSTLDVGSLVIEVVHTPGHSEDHLCFRVGNVLFTGDHIMGGSSVMVDDMGRYLESLRRLAGTGLTRLHPGHGDDMDDPDAVIDWYIAHRLQRHRQILDVVTSGVATIDDIVERVYADVDPTLYPLAARSVRAHLELLREEGRIAFTPTGTAAVPLDSP
jgi:glyoxylase-like metal-dependent hydrolase (beta-lactamase superfamily II)